MAVDGHYDDEQYGMGQRIREAAHERRPDLSMAALAEAAEMDPAEMARALAGTRPLSSIAVALLADTLGVDPYWVITGKPDPMRMRVIACQIRHPGEPGYVE